ncbi:tRNA lysidine(34) synthetase TilS [Candidatus Saccharibacteria bacterium RIFCSPHIGHO2_12_FULL_41_12]|nr:MAG: tRNA lysidine(34) synthetase TilS [Candidatus Saccharibacteria bacterium RIFCSPHIGHO2_12_FULL_41_12]
MEIEVKPGKYIVAVSGGVDSVVLLDLLVQCKELELVVAHFDHGIRPDSNLDQRFVKDLAKKYNLEFASEKGNLGENASEEKARNARYEFLHRAGKENHADVVITAHHQDDMLETALINLSRGTGRKGLSSLDSGNKILRPLLGFTKNQIIDYAKKKNLQWREDSTNQSDKYMRNRIRKKLAEADPQHKSDLLDLLHATKHSNREIDQILQLMLRPELPKKYLLELDHNASKELLAQWLRMHGIQFDKQLIEQLIVKAHTGRVGSVFVLKKDAKVQIDKQCLRVV